MSPEVLANTRPVRLRRSVPCAVLAVLLSPIAIAQEDIPRAAQPAGPPAEVSITDRGTVRMHVADMPLPTVLHLLSLEGRRNIIASPNVKGRVTANLYDVTFEQALAAILVANDAGFRTVGNFVYVYTKDELAQMDAATRPTPSTQVYYLNYVSAADVLTYLEPLVDKKQGGSITAPPAAATGLKSDSEDGGGHASAAQDFIIVTAGPEVHQTIRTVLKQIDIRPRQVLIEATILRANLTDENALGIDFTLVGGVDLEMLGARSNGITDVALGTLPQERYERFNATARSDLTGNVPSGGLTLGIIKDKVAVFLRALEEVTDTTVLANPKVLALNKQKGQVIVGRRDGFMTTTVTETQAIQTVQFLETGTQLVFRPFIGDDGCVRVELHPEDSVGFVNAQGLPSEQTTEVTTNVIVRDGETILIGGLFRELTTDARSQIPGLGSIPWLGGLFKSRSDSTNREEVIILLTIHLVDDHEAYAAASKEQVENVERMRVGLRKGLMWHGRERLAHSHYSKALEAMSAGDTNKALWHANMALHNNGRFVPAMRLKEKIIGEKAWDEDGTGGRGFMYELIAREKGYGLPRFGRPQLAPTRSSTFQDQTDPTAPKDAPSGSGGKEGK